MENRDESKSQHLLELASDLLDDIELSRLNSEALLLKATRLARLTNSEEIQQWLRFETVGYQTGSIAEKYMTLTGRWTDFKAKIGYWGPLAQQEAAIEPLKVRLKSLEIQNFNFSPSSSNPNEMLGLTFMRVKEFMEQRSTSAGTIATQIATLASIRSRVIGLIHDFVSQVYYEKKFSTVAESIFEQYKFEVDAKLSAVKEEVLNKIPAIYGRLQEGDTEAVSQALTSCRRIIDGFANYVYPPRTGTHNLGGKELGLGADKVKNRLNVFISIKIPASESRRQKLRQTLTNLYDRVSTGVHADVSVDEAKSLFLQTYIFLGEVISLGEPIPVSQEEISSSDFQVDAQNSEP